jgi:hypothetical protein
MCNRGERLARLRRYLGLLALLGGACIVAAHAAAAPALTPTLFDLRIVGTAHQEWSYTPAPVESNGCRRTETSEGIRTVRFRTVRPIRVRISGGKILPVTVRGVAGTVTLGGAITTEETCGGTGTSKTADCAQTRRSFAGASVRTFSPKPAVLTLASVRDVHLEAPDCPTEPIEVRRRPLGPLTKVLRLPKATLMERRLTRITLHASRTQRTDYRPPQNGGLTENGVWTFTFVRVQG